MANKPPLSIKWILIGAAIIIALNQMITELLREKLLLTMIESMGETGGILVFALIVALGSFFVGGIVIGWLSPGETLTEPALAATLAIIANLGLKFAGDHPPAISGALLSVVVGYALGFVGAIVGEKIQGETTEKMRERGEHLLE